MVFYYQDPGTKIEGVLNSDNVPFVIGIQTPFQLRMMLKYGHDGIITIDGTFATNNKGYVPFRFALNVFTVANYELLQH